MEYRNVVFNAARDGKLRRLKVRPFFNVCVNHKLLWGGWELSHLVVEKECFYLSRLNGNFLLIFANSLDFWRKLARINLLELPTISFNQLGPNSISAAVCK